ncbi:hypothetical protein JCM11491_005581 [Sporobolomyces phaffii]
MEHAQNVFERIRRNLAGAPVAYSSLAPGVDSPQPRSSTTSSPDWSHFSTPSSSKRRVVHPVLWFIVGFVLSSLLSAGVVQKLDVRKTRILVSPDSCEAVQQFELDRGIRVGPPPSQLRAVGAAGVPGPIELLSNTAPAASLYDALRDDLRYLTADSWSGEVGQLLSAFSLLHLARETQRIAIIPSVWRDGDHYGSSTVRMSDLFDMERFRRDTGTLFVEWSDVKPFDTKEGSDLKHDEIGCIFSWNGFADGRSFEDYKVSSSAWSVQRPYGVGSNHIEGHVLFDYDFLTRLDLLRQAAASTHRELAPNLERDQLLCYTNLWGLSRTGTSSPGTFWNSDYKDFDGVQATRGGMVELLHPSLRGVHPEWWSVGRYIDFTPAVWQVALLAVARTLELDDDEPETGRHARLPPLLTMHVRRGDFASWCPSGHGCVAPIERYHDAVVELRPSLPAETIVLVTTDETSPEFVASLRARGWRVVDHAAVGTAELLADRYGSGGASAWWDSAVDQAVLSLGQAFVGTLDSQVSLVSALRVATWNDGPTAFVKRPQ